MILRSKMNPSKTKLLVLFFSLAFLILCINASNPSKNREVFQAKSLIDSLLLKLHFNLNEMKVKEKAASRAESDARDEISNLRSEQVQAAAIQRLLHKLATGKNAPPTPVCAWHVLDIAAFDAMQPIVIRSKSAIPREYTISVKVNHRSLIDKGLAQPSGNDLRVYYQSTPEAEVEQLNRIISGLGTSQAVVSFSTQTSIAANFTNDFSYHLVFGSKTAGPAMDNPEKVYAFYDDFTDADLSGRWTKNWGEWTVTKGLLLGKTDRTPSGDSAEVGIYVTKGMNWKDVLVELDMKETSNGQYPGPFLRVLYPSVRHTTAWWFEYWTKNTKCTMRPYKDNNDGGWKYKANLPSPLQLNKWFHFKYQISGNKISQWVNGQLIQNNVQVENAWMVPKGTLGLGCHTMYGNRGCRFFWDNIKVKLLVTTPPQVSLGTRCTISHSASYLLGKRKLPANSCKQIHDASVLSGKPRIKNGLYWIRTKPRDLSTAVQTYCDMVNGGWTLVGKVSGSVGNIYNTWLVRNNNLHFLRSGPIIKTSNKMSCMDARLLALDYASEVMLASGDNSKGIGKKWVKWALPNGRELGSFWNHTVGQSAVSNAGKELVKITAWNGETGTCYQNKYGIMPYPAHGGSYPYASYNSHGNTNTNDYCMAVGVILKGARVHGWTQNANGYDSPKNDRDWPNKQYSHQTPYLTVWLK